MVGRCFCVKRGGRIFNRGERLGPRKEEVRRKLEDRLPPLTFEAPPRIGVFAEGDSAAIECGCC